MLKITKIQDPLSKIDWFLQHKKRHLPWEPTKPMNPYNSSQVSTPPIHTYSYNIVTMIIAERKTTIANQYK